MTNKEFRELKPGDLVCVDRRLSNTYSSVLTENKLYVVTSIDAPWVRFKGDNGRISGWTYDYINVVKSILKVRYT